MRAWRLAFVALSTVMAALPAVLYGQARPAATAAGTARPYSAPRTPWGDPDLQGAFTNSDESQTPMERPDDLAGRRLEEFTPEEIARLNAERNAAREKADAIRWELRSPLHWFENIGFKNSRAWMVSDPADGKIPALTPEARQRAAARTEARRGRGEADSYEDRSLFDRCISRGVPGSMMPAIYGNSYDITQGPGYVVIRYEMIHEARVIPLDGQPHASASLRSYMGDARGRFEGDTLVVETTNFNDRVPFRGSSDRLRLVERFTAVAPNTVEWSVTLEDPATWARPWTFAMNLSRVSDTEPPFEYACHEGNYAMFNLLSIARAEEAAAAAGAKPKP